jgi:hypothetical protein
MTLRRAIVLGYLTFAGVTVGTFLGSHGGWAGDVDPYIATIASPEAKNVHAPGMVFNKWKIDYNRESWVVRIFMLVNGPAYALALLAYKGLRMVPPFDDLFPFGISYPSYQLALALLFGAAQWYLIGTALERWRKRTRPRITAS